MTLFMQQLLTNGRFRFSLVILLVLVVFAIVGPFINDRNPLFAVGGRFDPPSAKVWLGTDVIGNDVFLQLMHGVGTSLKIGLIAGIVATFLGVLIGTFSGYLGGWLDEALMGATNVIITIPTIVILILLSVSLETRSLLSLGLVIGVTSWPWTARAVRAQTASLRTREHVDIAKLSGAKTLSIILWEILPYMLAIFLWPLFCSWAVAF